MKANTMVNDIKAGDKFIIEVGEILKAKNETRILYRIKGYRTLVFDKPGLDRLEKYNPEEISAEELKMPLDGYIDENIDKWVENANIVDLLDAYARYQRWRTDDYRCTTFYDDVCEVIGDEIRRRATRVE